MQDLDFNEVVLLICKEDPRFHRSAYGFVRQGLDFTVKELKKSDAKRAGKSLHVTGEELLMGLRAFALDQFGPMARTVLNNWGVTECSHFGDIVFNLIEYSVFSRNEGDKREDFGNIFTFEEAFDAPFRPVEQRQPRFV
ncbi:MAG: hypothetical protein SynsKO_10000 [Synoicihabitans sp.]